MSDTPFPSALREVQADFRKRPVIVGTLSLGLILGISGPFNTFEQLSAIPRVVYWMVVVVLTFVTGSFISTLVHSALKARQVWLVFLVSTLAIGLAVSIVLSLINLLVFGFWFGSLSSFFNLLGIVILISGVVELSSLALRDNAPPEAPERVPLMDRLPFDKRGAIIALSAEDHYVRIATTKGTELVLMRLSDAMKEVGGTAGVQVHRSHWVALDQVENVTRADGRAEVQCSDGQTRPISRGYMAAARAAGLLPSKRSG